jgi:putative lumazine-binding protein
MIKITIAVLVFALTFAFSVAAQEKNDETLIKEVIQSAYVDGLQNKGEIANIEKGFHPGFNLLIYKGNMMDKLPIYNWIEYAKMKLEKDPKPYTEDKKTTCEFVNIDITGMAAVAKIDLFKGGKKIYTDYLSLYNFEKDGWKIVGKIYFQYPKDSKH